MQLPSIAEYKTALNIVISDAPTRHLQMLKAHYLADHQKITAAELAKAAGYKGYSAANLQYGKFCRRLCEILSFTPPIGNSGNPTFTYVLATAAKISASNWEWTMHSSLAEALCELGIFSNGEQHALTEPVYADDIPPNSELAEGARFVVTVNAYERSRVARDACLDYWGAVCVVCEMDFESTYGAQSDRCIHVHHLVPLSCIGTRYEVNPVNDLRPVCPNCHSVLHTLDPPMSIAELRARIRGAKRG